MEPNVEIMCELLESNAIDLLWLQRTLGAMRYGIDLVDGVVNKDNDKHRQRDTNPIGNLMDAKQAI